MKKLFAWMLLGATCWAQNDEFLKEYSETRGYLLGRPVKGKITRDGRVFYLRSSPTSRTQSLYEWRDGREVLVQAPAASNAPLSAEEKARNERKRQLGTGFTDYLLSPDQKKILLPLAGQLWLYDLAKSSAQKLPVVGPVVDPQWSPDNGKVAYVRGQDLYCLDLKSKKEHPLTRGGTPEVSHGLAEFVAQEEMHRLSGFCWSPDSRQLAFEEADSRGVESWYLSDPLHPENPPVAQRYPRPTKKNVKVRVGLVEVGGGKVRWIATGDEYLGSLKWGQGGLTMQVQDRLQQRLRLLEIDPKKNRTRELLQERSEGWVPLDSDLPVWVDEQRFLFLRRRGDRMALALCGKNGVSQFLEDDQDFDIEEIVGYDKSKEAVLLRIDAQPGNPRLHWVGLKGKAPKDPDWEGVVEASLSPQGIVAQQQSMQDLPHLMVERKQEESIEGDAVAPSLKLHPRFETVEAEGLEFRTLTLLPENFQSERRYPVIVDVYGGPTKVQVAHNRRAWLMDQWLANQGFLVVAIDNRGTPGRGREWELAAYGKLAEVPLDDQVAALKALAAKHPEMDLERVGTWGWSFGGYLSAQAVLKYPEVFRAALAGAPVTDWMDYDTHYSERYLGLNPSTYKAASLLPLATQLKRPLLLVHGSADDNVYYRHSLKLSEALLRNGQEFELLTLPGITHSFRADVEITQEVWRRSVAFFKRHLGEPR